MFVFKSIMQTRIQNIFNSPYFQQAKLVGSGASGSDEQGWSVGLSADGNTLVIGGRVSTSPGAAWVFSRTGSTWTEQAKLIGSSNIGNSTQGYAVAVSGDGNTVAVGGPSDNSSIGATWIWTRSGSTWTEQAKIVGTGYTGTPGQGMGVSLSYDGNTLATAGAGLGATTSGRTWVFVRSGSTWSQQTSFALSGYSGSLAGAAVSLSSNGNVLAFGTQDYQIYTRVGTTWTNKQSSISIIGNNAASLSADGTVLAYIESGSVEIIYTLDNWTSYLGVSGISGGSSVSISSNGNYVAIGAPGTDGVSVGSVSVFSRTSTDSWTFTKSLTGSPVTSPTLTNQGRSVAIASNDGDTIASGAATLPGGASRTGATFVFAR